MLNEHNNGQCEPLLNDSESRDVSGEVASQDGATDGPTRGDSALPSGQVLPVQGEGTESMACGTFTMPD
jgi:hypothetical protein